MTWLRYLVDVGLLAWWAWQCRTVLLRPARRWPTRWLGKCLYLFVLATGFWTGAGLILPYGAVWVWWRIGRPRSDPFELPMADGRRLR